MSFQLTYTLLNYVLTLKEGMPPELNRPRFEYGPIGKTGRGDLLTIYLLIYYFLLAVNLMYSENN